MQFNFISWNEQTCFLSALFSIGYPEFILNPKELDKLYSDLMIESNEYFMNNVRSNQYSLRQNLIKLNEPVNKTLYVVKLEIRASAFEY